MNNSFRYLFLSLIGCLAIHASKLNLPRVLLPLFDSFSSNFTLEVSHDGCYKWSVSRLDIVQLIPINLNEDLECAQKAIISTISKEFIRNTAIVLVEEVSTGEVLRCDVIVDVISSLNIVTTTRQLYIEEAPEVFEVRAYDEQGNEFTTLEGVEFDWSISGYSQTDFSVAHNVLRFITFRDSPYEIPSTVRKLDTQDLKGHIVLIEGVKTGTAKVSVQLKEPEYKNVIPAEVQLNVIANLIIEPADVYLLEGDTIYYKLLQVRNGKLVELTLPSPQYYLKVEDDTVAAQISPWVMQANTIGRTKVVLYDRHVDKPEDTSTMYFPSATITVDVPQYLNLVLLPHKNWVVLELQQNTVTVEILNSKNHKFHIGASTRLNIKIPEEYYRIKETAQNGSYIHGWALMSGVAHVHATLLSTNTRLTAQEDMKIYPVLTIQPPVIYIPWDPNAISKFSLKLKATGGDGSYQWNTNDSNVASVSHGGLLKPHNLGSCKVTVTMQKNYANKASAEVFVQPPTSIDIIDSFIEDRVNTPMYLNVALYTEVRKDGKINRVPFLNCDNFPFKINILDNTFRYNFTSNVKPSLKNACSVISVIGNVVAVTKVTVSYHLEDRILEDSAMVSAFDPLQIVHPDSGETVLAVGSQRHIVFSGGPTTWGVTNINNENIMSYNNHSVIVVKEFYIRDSSIDNRNPLFVYTVMCNEIGEATVSLIINNSSISGSANVKVICAKPRYIQLTAATFLSLNLKSCPLTANSVKASVLNYEPIKLGVVIKDDRGMIFDNATSLNVKWTISQSELGQVFHPGLIMLEEEEQEHFRIPLRHFQVIIPRKLSGILEVTALVTSYRKSWLNEIQIISEDPPFGILNAIGIVVTPVIKATLTLILVDNVDITPRHLSIFNHPEHKAVLEISRGSGYYNVSSSPKDIAEVNYIDSSHSVEIIPKLSGILQIWVEDVCLESKKVEAEIHILKVTRIDAVMNDKVEVGRNIVARLKLYDSVGDLLSFIKPDLLDLRATADSNIIAVKYKDTDFRNDQSEITFVISGRKVGDTKLIFSAGSGKSLVNSSPIPVQVYSPLKLMPQNITIMPGSTFQIIASGGPTPNYFVEYYSTSNHILKVNSGGVIEGVSVGQVIVNGAAVGTDKVTGKRIVYSEAYVRVDVIYLDGIKIKVPLLKIKQGAKMPIWIEGIPEQLTPFILGTIKPSLVFKWSSSSPDVAHVKDVFHQFGIQVAEEDKLSMRIKGVKAGYTAISVNVTVPKEVARHHYTVYSDVVNLEVFEELSLIKPSDPQGRIFGSLLLSPDISTQLRTNKDSVGRLTYSFTEYTKPDGSKLNSPLLTITNKGTITTYNNYGRGLITVHCTENGYSHSMQISVEVKPVQYMMLNARSNLYESSEMAASSLPRGMKLEIHISYHDNIGNEFAFVKSSVKSHLSRLDRVLLTTTVESDDFFVDMLENGECILKVSDTISSLHPHDYVKLIATPHIHPTQVKISVGDVICFSMPYVKHDLNYKAWNVSDRDALIIEENLGIAVAKMKQTNVVISYQYSDKISTTTVVDILPLYKIKMLSHNDAIISNNNKRHTFPLLLVGESDSENTKTSNLISANECKLSSNYTIRSFPYECEIKFGVGVNLPNIADVFTVRQYFDYSTGLHSCVVDTVADSAEIAYHSRGNVILKVLWGHYNSEFRILNFVPAIHIYPTRITISCSQLEAPFFVMGLANVLNQLKVVASDDMLEVRKISAGSNSYKYSIGLKSSDNWMKDKNGGSEITISVTSALTEQNIKVLVIVKPFTSSGLACNLAALKDTSNYLIYNESSILIIITTLILGFIIYIVYNSAANRVILKSHPNADSSMFLRPNTSHIATPLSNQTSPSRVSFGNTPFNDIHPIYGDSSRHRTRR